MLPVLSFVRGTARRLGLKGEAAEHLKEAVEVVYRNAIENAFAPGDDGVHDVAVLRRPGRLVVAVEDRGLPGDYNRLEGSEGSALSAMLRRFFADEAHFVDLMYLRTNEEPECAIYPLAPFERALRRVVEHHGLRRTIADFPGALQAASSQISVLVRRDHNTADLREGIRPRLRELCLHRVDCVYTDLSLSHPATDVTGEILEELGFFFGCVVLEMRGGDVLRLQYLNSVEIEPGDVHTASDFEQEILDLIFLQKDDLERRAT